MHPQKPTLAYPACNQGRSQDFEQGWIRKNFSCFLSNITTYLEKMRGNNIAKRREDFSLKKVKNGGLGGYLPENFLKIHCIFSNICAI